LRQPDAFRFLLATKGRKPQTAYMQMNAALISEKLSKIDLLSLGRSTGFIRSTAQKITPSAFVLAFFVGIGHHARFSLSNWAEYLKLVSGTQCQ
jgi:hypothetical protein